MINSINIQIRETNTDDFDSIMTVEKQAFGYDKEAQLVADLLADKTAKPMVSLLAFYKGEAVGHILFTRAYFDGQGAQQMMQILAPLAVKPEYQRQGIGGMLIRAGIERLQEKGSCLVFVLGHKEYYQNMVLYRMQPGWVILLLTRYWNSSRIIGWFRQSVRRDLMWIKERSGVRMS